MKKGKVKGEKFLLEREKGRGKSRLKGGEKGGGMRGNERKQGDRVKRKCIKWVSGMWQI